MKAGPLILAGGLLVVALIVIIARLDGDPAGPVVSAPHEVTGTAVPRRAGKSHPRKPVEHRIATATIKRIDHDWGFVVLSLERGKFAKGNVGYLDRRGENGGTLKLESVIEREAVANIEDVGSTELSEGDLVLFSPDLVMLSGYNIDVAQVEWVSE